MSKEAKTDKQFDVPLADHEYDGIQEFDNPAPFWWQLFFYLSILFAFQYYIYYEFGSGLSTDAQLAKDLAAIEVVLSKNKPAGPDESSLKALATDVKALKTGKEAFISKCAACHAPDGGGLIGPNLTDKFWIHGKGTLPDLFKVINDGVADKGMPPWGSVLSATEMQGVVVYVASLQGTKPAQAKAPQGNEIK